MYPGASSGLLSVGCEGTYGLMGLKRSPLVASGAEDWCILIPQVTRADPWLFLFPAEWLIVGALSTVQVLVLLGKEAEALVSVSWTLLVLYQSHSRFPGEVGAESGIFSPEPTSLAGGLRAIFSPCFCMSVA